MAAFGTSRFLSSMKNCGLPLAPVKGKPGPTRAGGVSARITRKDLATAQLPENLRIRRGFLAQLAANCGAVGPRWQRWYRILSEALKRYLKGPPARPRRGAWLRA